MLQASAQVHPDLPLAEEQGGAIELHRGRALRHNWPRGGQGNNAAYIKSQGNYDPEFRDLQKEMFHIFL